MHDVSRNIVTLFDHLNHLNSSDEVLFKFIHAVNYIFSPVCINMVDSISDNENLYIDLKVQDEVIGKLEVENISHIEAEDIIQLKRATERLCQILTRNQNL